MTKVRLTLPRKTAPVPFYHQDVYSSLCGFYACAHFLKAGTTEKVFVSKTTTFYAERLKDVGVAREFCRDLALTGNDPEAVANVLKGEAERKQVVTPGDFDYYSRMLLVLRTAQGKSNLNTPRCYNPKPHGRVAIC